MRMKAESIKAFHRGFCTKQSKLDGDRITDFTCVVTFRRRNRHRRVALGKRLQYAAKHLLMIEFPNKKITYKMKTFKYGNCLII